MKAQTATMSVESPNAEAVYSGALNPSELARYFNSSNSAVVSEAEEARGLKRELGRTAVPLFLRGGGHCPWFTFDDDAIGVDINREARLAETPIRRGGNASSKALARWWRSKRMGTANAVVVTASCDIRWALRSRLFAG
jgi:hypothetical protein